MATFTFWTAIVVVILTVIALVKRIETRFVLLAAGLFLCVISLNPMSALNQFVKSMTNSGLIQSICSAMGFAFLVGYTKADMHLVQLLTRPMKALGIFLIPACTIVTAIINAAIPSAAGCAAAVATTLLPVMIRAGISPAGAGAAILAGTYGSCYNPGIPHIVMISEMAGIQPMEFIISHSLMYAIMIAIGAALVTVVELLLKDHKTSGSAEGFEGMGEKLEKINLLWAAAPLVPLVILLLGNTCVPALKMGVAHAMLIGVIYTMIVTLCNPQKAIPEFFNGAGKGYGNVLGIIIAAGVFAGGLREAGLVDALIEALKNVGDFARIGGGGGVFLMAILTGSGDAATFAFNEAVTPHAPELGMTISNLGNTALVSAQLGRTMSPVAGVVILISGLCKVNPLELVKRTAIPMIVCWLAVMIFF
ncbi:C4-dicarboxylate transporter DcuC [Sutterella sp.]|uniref:C4-dicarboxylate transporter DcuC n=1 Tax=Sutterella sp. TaxID=1981025 RepID=UPI0026DF8060|nr:C4-dicarboxylate transporter DcuC [Sutterella sp.]MDO5530880.1 C4-dicarboxylate transporter DcuC [Sutterella sp.]